MKKLALSLILASFSFQASAKHPLHFSGAAAKEFYEIMNVEETKVKPSVDGGINPLRASKSYESEQLNIYCEKRLHSTGCNIGAESESYGRTFYLTIKGTAADTFCNTLNVHNEARDDMNGGINPLTCKKSFKSSDEAIHVTCSLRLFGEKSCHIYYYHPET